MCLLGVGLLSVAVFGSNGENSLFINPTELAPKIGFLFGFCALSALWILWQRTGPLFTLFQFFVDVGIITGLIYVTGGSLSPFSFLYLPLIIGAAVLCSRRVALTIAFVSITCYSSLLTLLYLGKVSPYDGVGGPILLEGIVLQVVGLGSALILVAVAASYLGRVLTSKAESAAETERNLHQLSSVQQVLIDSLPDGVVTTSVDGIIKTVNELALHFFGCEEEDIIGRNLQSVLDEMFPDRPIKISIDGKKNQAELEFVHEGEEDARKVIYSSYCSEEERDSTAIHIFHDVTTLRSVEEQLDIQERMAKLLADQREPSGISHPGLPEFVGESLVMRKVFQLISKVSHSEANVLVAGESGTGKELVARAIHVSGPRSDAPFVAINCGAVPENLIESELFGHKRGSFTGAESDHRGLFEQANGGTIFLDEIGELPLALQAKLLRALQEHRVRPVGAEHEIEVDVRVVSATNRNLKLEVAEGRFREDLYYRLNVIAINLPPLRERKEDLPILVNAILKRIVSADETPVVPPATMKLLFNHSFPGNVRELENLLERAYVLGGEVLLPEHIDDYIHSEERREVSAPDTTEIIIADSVELPVDLDEILSSIEQRYLRTALVESQGVKKKAAQMLGMNFRSFRYRLQKFDIQDDAG